MIATFYDTPGVNLCKKKRRRSIISYYFFPVDCKLRNYYFQESKQKYHILRHAGVFVQARLSLSSS